ncbi:MAG: GYD domain-containing protein [Actinobacteria bacterium]|nr:GYD domain-containing protein [Actinomycetota bacterium]
MPIYILLTTLTAQGVQTLRSNPERLRQVNADVEELGAKVLHQWATLGPFDFLNVVEAPDETTIAKVSIALGARGSAKLQTMTAMSIDDFLAALEV